MRVAVCGLGSYVARVGVIPALRNSTWTQFLGGYTSSDAIAAEVLTDTEFRYPDYEALLSDPAVDAVYLPLPNDLHLDFIEQAVRAGKHVLCEKPLLLDEDAYDRLDRLLEGSSQLVTEAFMSSYHPRLRQVIARATEFGDIVSVATSFTGTLNPLAGYRLDATRGGGSLYDVGIYALFPIVSLLGAEPLAIHTETTTTDAPHPVDLTLHCMLRYAGGAVGTFVTSFISGESQNLRILTTAASLEVNKACTPGPNDIDWTLTNSNGTPEHQVSPGIDPYLAMVDEVFTAFSAGHEPSWTLARSRELARLLYRIEHSWRQSATATNVLADGQ